jgi:hypothetical protein
MAAATSALLDLGHDIREVGHLAVWTVTSAKPGNGVELLRDGNKDTYWQSDGTQPHLVDIQFQKKMHVQVCGLIRPSGGVPGFMCLGSDEVAQSARQQSKNVGVLHDHGLQRGLPGETWKALTAFL